MNILAISLPINTIMKIVLYIAFNYLIFGFKGILGGFLPVKVELSVGAFYVLRKNAYNSEKLTRIVSERFYGGDTVDEIVRNEILDKYGPVKSKSLFHGHYKKINNTTTL